MAIEFANLIDPQVLSIELTIMLFSILGILAYIGIKLRSSFVLASWALSFLILILTFTTNLSFIWFWVVIVLTILLIPVSGVVRYVF